MDRRFRCWFVLGLLLGFVVPAAGDDAIGFRTGLGKLSDAAEKHGSAAVTGRDGWLFVTAELRMMSVGPFWGADAAKVSRAPKPETADPLPAIVDFNRQLSARGIHLLLVPVPPKARIYPEEVAADLPAPAGDPDPALAQFYTRLTAEGVDVLDLAPAFLVAKNGENGPVFCHTDTHWSGAGCVLAAQLIAGKVRAALGPSIAPTAALPSDWNAVSITGDLAGMLAAGDPKPGAEQIRVRQARTAFVPNPASPVLLLGDSHTLVFHDFLAERAGLVDQLAIELGAPPDLIGVRGSGATPVRISLYRKSLKDPDYLTKKKVVIWCFTAREFTESAQGWQILPVGRPGSTPAPGPSVVEHRSDLAKHARGPS